MAEYNIILPIDSMAAVTMKANYETPHARKETLDQIHELDICTGDEIENLYHSEVNNAETNVRNIENMERQNEIISKLQSGLILVLADLVESRDKNTGDHVNKTADYTRIIMQQLRKNGVYTDQLTDEFIEDVVHSAPLHDVGKIKVPDAILTAITKSGMGLGIRSTLQERRSPFQPGSWLLRMYLTRWFPDAVIKSP